MTREILLLILAMVSVAPVAAAEERPSWAVTNAADRLIASHALFLSGRDGFVKLPDGRLVQYELPGRNYSKDGKDWMVELRSRRWRKEGEKQWMGWNDPRPHASSWRIGVIRVQVLAEGVTARWEEGVNFIGCKAPREAEVTQRLDTHGRSYIETPAERARTAARRMAPPVGNPNSPRSALTIRPRRAKATPGSGIFRQRADGSLEKVNP